MNSGSKAATAFRTIGEVAKELRLDTHVLRFWEIEVSAGQAVQGGAGNRRYYRPEDVDLLRKIKRLLHEEGYTIEGALRLLSGSSAVEPRDGHETVRQAVKGTRRGAAVAGECDLSYVGSGSERGAAWVAQRSGGP